ncbi:MAG: hypothetical protein IKJ52_03935 [Muribaculaceae bacterium]|nr:hypothetical protein [Muribaculaceae bacterium]
MSTFWRSFQQYNTHPTPYPLSYHGLGKVAMLFFFGIISVMHTYYVQSLQWSLAFATIAAI